MRLIYLFSSALPLHPLSHSAIWFDVPAPSVGIDASVTLTTTQMTVVLHPPFDTGSVGDGVMGNHPDVLGYLGFPKTNGLLQINLLYHMAQT